MTIFAAILAAADTTDTAAATREQSAAFVTFQRQQPSHSPTQNVQLAACSLNLAAQLGGNIANNAQIATTTATFTTFGA